MTEQRNHQTSVKDSTDFCNEYVTPANGMREQTAITIKETTKRVARCYGSYSQVFRNSKLQAEELRRYLQVDERYMFQVLAPSLGNRVVLSSMFLFCKGSVTVKIKGTMLGIAYMIYLVEW
jgi:hypothetical protein